MRMMGRNSVEYHRATVLERIDDHPGLALEYYASRGETPLVWGGSGAKALGLSGPVTPGLRSHLRTRRSQRPQDWHPPGEHHAPGHGAGHLGA